MYTPNNISMIPTPQRSVATNAAAPYPVTAAGQTFAPVSTALLASVLSGTTTLGRNLYKTRNGEMTVREAVTSALVVGASTTLLTTMADRVAAAVTSNDAGRMIVFGAVMTGASYYLINAADKTNGTQ